MSGGTLGAYLRRRVGAQILALLLVLAALMQVLELLDVTTDILERELGLGGLVRYAWLRAPGELVMALPLAVLLGGMTAFHAMARHQEITAMRSAGIGLGRIFAYLLPLPLLLALAQFALSQTLVPRFETELKRWWDETALPEDAAADPTWVNTDTGPVALQRSSADGRRIEGLRLYEIADDRALASRLTADSAQWRGGAWQLENVTVLRISAKKVTRSHEAERVWSSNLHPDDVTRLKLAQPHLSSMMLADTIAGERVGAQPLSYYRTVFFRSFTSPLGLLVMLLLALPAAAALSRGGGSGQLLTALGLGLGFMLCDGLIASLGTGGRLPPLAAALAAPVVFAVLGMLQLRAYDRR